MRVIQFHDNDNGIGQPKMHVKKLHVKSDLGVKICIVIVGSAVRAASKCTAFQIQKLINNYSFPFYEEL